MDAAFIFMMFVLKIPVAILFYIVWWAIKSSDEAAEAEVQEGDGGTKQPRHPRGPIPRSPRRGGHADPAPTAPPRVRPLRARARTPASR